MLKKLAFGLMLFGWIPTLAIVFSARWIAGSVVLAQGHVPIKITRLYTGSDGKTTIEEFEVPLNTQNRGTFRFQWLPPTSNSAAQTRIISSTGIRRLDANSW